MPKRFDPDTALKPELLARYKRLASDHERLKKRSSNTASETARQVELAKASAAAKVKRELEAAEQTRWSEAEQHRAELARRDQEIAELGQTLEQLTVLSGPRAFVRVELRPGLRSNYPDQDLYLDLLIHTETKFWCGGRALGYARNRTDGNEVYPFLLDNERLDYGADFQDDRDGRLQIKGRAIEVGQLIPFFPDGRVSPASSETYIVMRVIGLLQGK